ncbi:hypothetical protein V2J09_023959 [Rumex salicifolius]
MKEGCLVWEDITVQLPNSPNNSLLDGLSGYAKPGRVLAFMGPSGSGKTTLLDSLAGRLHGSLIISGKYYVPQEDIFIGTLTVEETILYSAHLRLPSTKTNEDIRLLVDDIIGEMGLRDCANSKIGNWHLRGLSGGEKKRLSIGLALITQPHVFLLDEPTSGLDSAAAFFVTQSLKNVADEGKIVAFSVHQPSSEVFELFDDLLLISGGQVVFFGEANLAIKFFAEAGFPCPNRRSPCDHFLRCINSDFDRVMASLDTSSVHSGGAHTEISAWKNMKIAEIRSILIEKNKQSAYSTEKRMKTDAILFQEATDSELDEEKTSNWKQLYTLTSRSFTNMCRDIGYHWLRMAFYISVSISVGSLFNNLGTDYGSLISIQACEKFIFGFMICLSGGGVPFFTEEIKIFYRERSNGDYGEAIFVLSNFISSFPFVATTSCLCATILYHMLKFKEGMSYFFFLVANLYGGMAVMEGCMMSAAAILPHMFMAIVVGTGFNCIMILSSSVLEPLSSLPKFFWRYPMSYISFTSWAIEGQLKNDLLGREFNPMIPGEPKLTGETILRELLGDDVNHSKWWDMAIVIFLSLCYRVVFYLLVKFKGQTTSFTIPAWFRRAIKSSACRRVKKITRDHVVFSKRHQPPHSLSSQEGLGSPLP